MPLVLLWNGLKSSFPLFLLLKPRVVLTLTTNRSIVTLLPWPAKMTFMSAAIFDWASLVGSGDESDMDSEVEDRVDGVKSLLSKSKGSAKTLSDEGTQKTTRSVWNPFSYTLRFHFKDWDQFMIPRAGEIKPHLMVLGNWWLNYEFVYI